MKLLWFSRHGLDDIRLGTLADALGCVPEDIEVCTTDLRWHASPESGEDITANVYKWREIAGDFDAVAGEFPTVAFEALDALRELEGRNSWFDVWVPIEERTIEAGTVVSRPLRWARM